SYDRLGMEEHFRKMAEKGWLIDKIDRLGWRYRRIEPQKLAFSVCYFPTASQFDPGPSEEQETFYDFCEHTGWVLAASSAQLQIFYNERPNPVPIETDPAEEVDTIHRAMKRSFIPSWLILLLIELLEIRPHLSDLVHDPIGTLSSTPDLLSLLCWALVFLASVIELIIYFRWHRKAEQAAEHGEFYSAGSHRWFQFGCLAFLAVWLAYFLLSVFLSGDKIIVAVFAAIFLIYLPGMFCIVNGIKGFLKRRGASAKVNRIVTWVGSFALGMALLIGIITGTGILYGIGRGWFESNSEVETYVVDGHTYEVYNDPLPLTVSDLLTGAEENLYTRQRREHDSPLLTLMEGREKPRYDVPRETREAMSQLDYTVVVVKVPLFYEMCKEKLFHAGDGFEEEKPEKDRYSWQPVDPAPWGAVEAYQWGNSYGGLTHFLLCYETRIVELELSYRYGQTIGAEGMAQIGETLGRGNL
ncbi:MAG: DUF2812 domain-containing protein, partial [Oscillospiraceae bacterium]|nr:DUF2812 domain-containing protein [Oscillospiraceae bacterium]